MCPLFGNFCHVFGPHSHIREKIGTLFGQFVSRFPASFAYKGKIGDIFRKLCMIIFRRFLSRFWGHSAYKGKICVIFRRFLSRFLAQIAYKGKIGGHLTFLGNQGFSRREQLAATDMSPFAFWFLVNFLSSNNSINFYRH